MIDCQHHLIHHEGYAFSISVVFCNKCGREWHLGNIYAREDDGSEWISLQTYPPRVKKKWDPPTIWE